MNSSADAKADIRSHFTHLGPGGGGVKCITIVQSNISGGRNQCRVQQCENIDKEAVGFHVILQLSSPSSDNEAVTNL